MDDIFLPTLSQNLLENLDEEEYYDITIEVGSDPYVKIFRAHMVILNCRSPYLRRILSINKKENDGTLVHIKLPNILPETFQIILRYIYGGRLSLEEHDTLDIIKILVAASELSLKELIIYIQSFLIKNSADWMEQNFVLMYQTSFTNSSFTKLQGFCAELMSKKPENFFKSSDFTSITEKSLISCIQHDNLQVREVQVWEYVLKWGLAQNLDLPSNPASFSKSDFNTLKNTLQQCIPFIKFYNLTSREFLDSVFPYKKILPKELREHLLKHFLNPDNKESEPKKTIIEEIKVNSKNIDSKIITSKHAELISKWVDRLEITDEIKNSYEFKLILRGSRDGFSASLFHEICDGQSRTVSIIKVQDSNEILGGYNPIAWNSNGDFDKTNDSFIFSFKNNDRIENHILSRVNDERYAIYNVNSHGPSFGRGDLDLHINDYCDHDCYCSGYCSYENSINETEEFSIEEYEVFKIIKVDI